MSKCSSSESHPGGCPQLQAQLCREEVWRWRATVQEVVAVMSAARQWRCHLEAKEVMLVTGHKPNTYLDSQPSVQLKSVATIACA
ncbi:hypothetical protein WJX77_012168 [Trebouxia sp. C0004]